MDGALQQGADAVESGFRGDAVGAAKVLDFAVFDELVGPADADNRGGELVLVEALKDGGTQASPEARNARRSG